MSFWKSLGSTLGTAAGSAAAIGVINLFAGDEKSSSGQRALPKSSGSSIASGADAGDFSTASASNLNLGLKQSRRDTFQLASNARNNRPMMHLANFSNNPERLGKVREVIIAQLVRGNVDYTFAQNLQKQWSITDQELLKARQAVPKIQGFAKSITVGV